MTKNLPALVALMAVLSTTTTQAYHIGSITNAMPHELVVERANFSVNSCYNHAEIRPLEMKGTVIQSHTTHPYFSRFPGGMEVGRMAQFCPTNGIYNIILYKVNMKVGTGETAQKVTCKGDSHGKNSCIPHHYQAKLAVTPTGMPLLTIKEGVH